MHHTQPQQPRHASGFCRCIILYVGKCCTPLQLAPLPSKHVAGLKEASRLLIGIQIWLSAYCDIRIAPELR